MKVNVWKCDKCGNEFRQGGGSEIAFHVDNDADEGDGHNVRIFKRADLCLSCTVDFSGELLESCDMRERAVWAKAWGAAT